MLDLLKPKRVTARNVEHVSEVFRKTLKQDMNRRTTDELNMSIERYGELLGVKSWTMYTLFKTDFAFSYYIALGAFYKLGYRVSARYDNCSGSLVVCYAKCGGEDLAYDIVDAAALMDSDFRKRVWAHLPKGIKLNPVAPPNNNSELRIPTFEETLAELLKVSSKVSTSIEDDETIQLVFTNYKK